MKIDKAWINVGTKCNPRMKEVVRNVHMVLKGAGVVERGTCFIKPGELKKEVMDVKKIRGLFNQARRSAARFAEKCDFVAAEEIKKSWASCSEDTAFVGALYKDPVERVQILTSYTYASGLLGLNFFTSAGEDGTAEDGKRYMLLTLSLKSEAK